ncbi:MAG: anti-sigma factor domain-containing protein [Planctomycetota bacterium]|jgi:hypothetical protein
MNKSGHSNPARRDELLADRATQYLSVHDGEELRALLSDHPRSDDTSFDRVASALELAWIADEVEPMPQALRDRVEVNAVAWLAERKGLKVAGGDAATAPAPRPARRFTGSLPWLAAAACLVLALIGWWPAGGPAPARERVALLNEPTTRTIAWQNSPAGVSGDVVWNNERQEGYLRFRGLAVNDPDVMQYQLWIFDESRSEYSDNIAVDGGVFDVDTASGDVIVPIRAKLVVGKPVLFAVTTEPPGGVVKHDAERDPDRYKIILTAS